MDGNDDPAYGQDGQTARAAVIVCLAVGLWHAGESGSSRPGGTIAVSGGGAREGILLFSPPSGINGRKVAGAPLAIDAELSPDGQPLWSRACKASGSRIATVPARGSFSMSGTWSSGRGQWPGRLTVAGWRSFATNRCTRSSRGGSVTSVTSHADAPAWSSDGTEIVFVRNPEQSSRDGTISAIGTDGRGLRRIVAVGKWFGPSVSPDGSKIAFYRNGVRGVYVASAKGGRARLVIRNGYQPTWSPDGALSRLRARRCLRRGALFEPNICRPRLGGTCTRLRSSHRRHGALVLEPMKLRISGARARGSSCPRPP